MYVSIFLFPPVVFEVLLNDVNGSKEARSLGDLCTATFNISNKLIASLFVIKNKKE